MPKPAILALADGTVLTGTSIGREGTALGEVIFNTAMTGYQEILTDPSYAKQIVTLTYPHIGNTGVNTEDMESHRVWMAGLVIRNLPLMASNYRSEMPLQEFLQQQGTIAAADVDTRHLATLVRTKGAMGAALIAGTAAVGIDNARAVAMAKEFAGLQGMNLAQEVSTDSIGEWRQGSWRYGGGFRQPPPPKWHVVAYDLGIKRNILRLLADRGCKIQIVPAATSAQEALQLAPDGIFLSNGPGDPAPCTSTIAAVREFLNQGIPLFGICLGHQILALACDAQTIKMKYGHHGANHPVKDMRTGRVLITSQNHGFAVSAEHLPASLEVTHLSLFDDSIQGIAHKTAPAFGFQGHPEASPGPHDARHIFDRFIDAMEKHNGEPACPSAQTSKAS